MRLVHMRLRNTAAALLLLPFGACLSPPDRHAYDLHSGPALPVSEVSVVLLADAAVARFDGMTAVRSDWTEVRLRPGSHRIEWSASVPEESSPQFDLAWLDSASRFIVVLEPGHTYSLRTSSDTGIVDETTARPAPTLPWETP